MKNEKIIAKVRVSASNQDIMDKIIRKIKTRQYDHLYEKEFRKEIVSIVDKLIGDECIFVEGHKMYSPKKLIRDFKEFYENEISHTYFTDYLHDFFVNRCAAIAYHNKEEWVDNYGTRLAIKGILQNVSFRYGDYDGPYIIGEFEQIIINSENII